MLGKEDIPWFTVSTFEKEWFPSSLFLSMYSSVGSRAVFTFLASARDLVLSLNTKAQTSYENIIVFNRLLQSSIFM